MVIGVCHIAVLAGGSVDLLGCADQIVPSPVLVRVSYTGSIEHLLVIHQTDRVLVLGDCIQGTVGAHGVGQRDLRELVLFHNVGAVCQHPVVGILQQLVGVHPENIRHLVAGGCSLQLGPVFVPAGDLHLNADIRVLLGVGRTHRLHAFLLCNVPDLEGQCLLAAGRTAAAVAAAGCQHGCGAHCRHCLYELSARDLHFCSPPKSLFRRVIFVLCRTGRVDFLAFVSSYKSSEKILCIITLHSFFSLVVPLLYYLPVVS